MRAPTAAAAPHAPGMPARGAPEFAPDAPRASGIGSGRLWGRWRVPVLIAGAACVALGMAWLDPLLYQFSKSHLDTPSPYDSDFYRRTRMFWDIFRLPGSVGGGLLAFFVIGMMHRDRWRMATRGFFAVVGADLATLLIQFAFGRARPNQSASHLDFRGPIETFRVDGLGCFPSGEATASFALAYVLSCVYPRGRLIFFALAAINTAARLVPGAHYFSDVCAGAALGTVLSATVFHLLKRPFTAPERASA